MLEGNKTNIKGNECEKTTERNWKEMKQNKLSEPDFGVTQKSDFWNKLKNKANSLV